MTKTKEGAKTPKPETVSAPDGQSLERPGISETNKTRLFWAAGIATIAAGFVLLVAGSVTSAAALLVVGYCAFVPMAILSGGTKA